MKRPIFAGVILAMSVVGIVFTLSGKTRLLDKEFDFGVIPEQEGPQTGVARVVNDGPDTTYIRDVRPSCGCTGVDYTPDVLMPGDTTSVHFTYDPAGRPGNFTKTVKIYCGDGDERHMVTLKGTVVGTPETLSKAYPIECGPLRLSERVVTMQDVEQGKARHAFVRIVNQSMDTVTPEWTNDDKALSLGITPAEIEPGGIATFGIYFNSRLANKEGNLEYTVPFHAKGYPEMVDLKIMVNTLPARAIEEEKD